MLLFIVMTTVWLWEPMGIHRVSAGDEETYYFTGIQRAAVLRGKIAGETIYYDGYYFCANLDKKGPSESNTGTYTKTRLSALSFLTAEQKSKIVAIQENTDWIQNKVSDLKTESELVEKFDEVYGFKGSEYRYAQLLIWYVLNREVFFGNVGSSCYSRLQDLAGDTTGDDPDDPNSLWSVLFAPLMEYVDSVAGNYTVGTGEDDYDALYFISADDELQDALGVAGRNGAKEEASLTLKKVLRIETDLVKPEDLMGTKFFVYSEDCEYREEFALTDFMADPEAETTENDHGFSLEITGLKNQTYYVMELPAYDSDCDLSIVGYAGTFAEGSTHKTSVHLQAGSNEYNIINRYVAKDRRLRLVKILSYDSEDPYNEVYHNILISLYVDKGDGIELYDSYHLGDDELTEDDSWDGYYSYTGQAIDLPDDPSYRYYLAETGAEADGYQLSVNVKDSQPVWNEEFGCNLYYIGKGGEYTVRSVQRIENYYKEKDTPTPTPTPEATAKTTPTTTSTPEATATTTPTPEATATTTPTTTPTPEATATTAASTTPTPVVTAVATAMATPTPVEVENINLKVEPKENTPITVINEGSQGNTDDSNRDELPKTGDDPIYPYIALVGLLFIGAGAVVSKYIKKKYKD